MTEYTDFTSLEFDRPEEWILRITLRNPAKLNAVGAEAHGQLAEVWHAIDRDPATRVVVVRGADGAFSSGGDLDLVVGVHHRLGQGQRLGVEVDVMPGGEGATPVEDHGVDRHRATLGPTTVSDRGRAGS